MLVKKRARLTLLITGLLLVTLFALAAVASAAATVTITLSAQNNSGETGTAELTDMGGGKTKVVVTTKGQPAGVTQPAHIHEGTCTNLTATPKYPLTSLTNGKSETVVNVALADLLAKPYAVNVHKSAQEASVYVACGNITAQAAPGTTPSSPPKTGAGGMSNSLSPLWIVLGTVAAIVAVGGAVAVRRRA